MKVVKLEEVFSNVLKFFNNYPVFALETGCSFLWEAKNMTNLSTYNIAKYLLMHDNSTLLSLDNNLNHINNCKYHLIEHDLHDKVILNYVTDSADFMEAIEEDKFFNFFWLDTSEDVEHGLREYEAALKLADDRFVICIDDYGCDNSVKWKLSSDRLKKESSYYQEYNTATGLIVGYYE